MELNLIKLAILNDLLGQELANISIKDLLDNNLKCKLKNGIKSSNSISAYFDEMFSKNKKSAEQFGEMCDILKEAVDNFIKKHKDVRTTPKTIEK